MMLVFLAEGKALLCRRYAGTINEPHALHVAREMGGCEVLWLRP
jgi:hypothetical protein